MSATSSRGGVLRRRSFHSRKRGVIHALGRRLAVIDHHGLLLVSEPDEHEAAAADAAREGIRDAQHRRRGDGRVNGVSTSLERLDRGPGPTLVHRRRGASLSDGRGHEGRGRDRIGIGRRGIRPPVVRRVRPRVGAGVSACIDRSGVRRLYRRRIRGAAEERACVTTRNVVPPSRLKRRRSAKIGSAVGVSIGEPSALRARLAKKSARPAPRAEPITDPARPLPLWRRASPPRGCNVGGSGARTGGPEPRDPSTEASWRESRL